MKFKSILLVLLMLLSIPIASFADNNKINGTCPGEVIEEMNGATSDVAHNEKGAIGGKGNDRYRIRFNAPGVLKIDAVNRNPKKNGSYKFYISRNSCGNNDSDWNIVSAEVGKEHHHTVNVKAGDTIYIRLQATGSAQEYYLKLDFKVLPVCANEQGLNGKYYNNTSFQDPVVLERVDNTIDFNWGSGSPDSSKVNKNSFSIVWSGFLLAPDTANYTFYLAHDDKMKLIIDGNTVYNGTGWTGGSNRFRSSNPIHLSRGCHTIRVEFIEYGGGAYARIKWKNDASIPNSVIISRDYLFHNPPNSGVCHGCDCSLDANNLNSSTPGIAIPGLDGARTDISRCISGITDEAEGDPDKNDYYHFTVAADGVLRITTSSPNNHAYHMQVWKNGQSVYGDPYTSIAKSHNIPTINLNSGDKIVVWFKENGSNLDEYQANFDFRVTQQPGGGSDFVPDLCYEEYQEQNTTCGGLFGMGMFAGSNCFKQSINIKNRYKSNLTDVKVDVNLSKVGNVQKEDCGVDGSSGNCQDVSGDSVRYTMPNYGAKDIHSIYLTSDRDDDILSKNLYATYTKAGVRHRIKVSKCHVSYCEKHNLSEGFHIIDPDGGDESNSFEIYCDMTSDYAPRDLIALPIKTQNNYNNNFVYDKDKLTTLNYYKEAKDHGKPFNAIEVDLYEGMKVITRTTNPLQTGNYYTMGRYFSNINLIGTPFGIDWNDINISRCDVNKLRKAYHGQAVKVNLLDYTKARCEIGKMKLKLLDDYKYLTYLGREILEHSCKEMSENVPANVLASKDIKGHYWIYPRKDANDTTTTRDDAIDDITKANERPIVVYCWYQTDLNWAWTFLLSLDGVVTNSKDDIMAKRDTCSQLGLWFFVPNSKETFDRVRRYLLKQKSGDLGWENYTGTVREKYKTYRNNPRQEYYLPALGYELIWPYGPLGIYYPCRGHHDATNGCSNKAWYPGRTNVRGWMSGSPMHNIKTLPNYADSMGAKGWISILGSQDLNITDEWWVSDIGAGREFGPKPPPPHIYSYNPHGTHILTSGSYPYYEPNGNYAKNAWLNFLHDDEGWIYHNDDNNDFYAYYDYMCMSETNYITATRYLLVPGFFNTIERGTRAGNTPPSFSDDRLTTQLVNRPINLDLILYKFDINGSTLRIDRSKLETDFNKSVGVFLAIKDSNNNDKLKLVKFLGTYKDFDKYNGRIPLKTFSVDRAYEKAFLHYYYCQQEGKDWTECWDYKENNITKEISVTHITNTEGNASDSYDSFSIRPDYFEIDASSVPSHIVAGDEFNLTLKALDGNSSNPQPAKGYNKLITIDWGAPALGVQKKTSCIKGKLELAKNSPTHFTDGVAHVTLKYDEVGDINITLNEYQGSEFAKIDANDTDFNATIHDNALGLNPQDIYREINSTKATDLKFTPSHFDINGTFKDFHLASSPNDMNFTYVSNDLNMSSVIEFEIIAKNSSGQVTKNYNDQCDAKDITKLDIFYLINGAVAKDSNSSNPNPGNLDKIKFELKDDKIYKYSSTSTTQTLSSKLSLINLPALIFNTDHNGSAKLTLKLNFDRRYNQPVQPFKFTIQDMNISDANGIENNETNITGSATYLYGRVKSAQKLYDDITSNSTKTPISIVVYSLPAGAVSLNGSLFTTTNEYDWVLNTIHDITKDGVVELETTNSNGTVTPTPSISSGMDANVLVTATKTQRPLEVDVNLTGTNRWLIFNPDKNEEPAPFYRVRFIDNGNNWSGYGKTGDVVDTNTSSQKTRRLEW